MKQPKKNNAKQKAEKNNNNNKSPLNLTVCFFMSNNNNKRQLQGLQKLKFNALCLDNILSKPTSTILKLTNKEYGDSKQSVSAC